MIRLSALLICLLLSWSPFAAAQDDGASVVAQPASGIQGESAVSPAGASGQSSISWSDFDLAVRRYNSGNYEEAYGLLRKIYAVKLTDAQNRSVRFLLGVAAYRLGRFDEVDVFLGRPGLTPDSLARYSLYYVAQAAYARGQYERSRSLLHDYLKRYPDSPWEREAALTRAEALFHLGRPLEALRECQPLLKEDHQGEVRLAMARIYESLGRIDEARDNYARAMESSNTRLVRPEATRKYKELLRPLLERPGYEKEKLALVTALRREWRLEESLELIDRLMPRGGSDDYLDQLRGEKAKLLFFSGEIQQAIKYYQWAAEPAEARKNPYTVWMYARSLERLGRWEDAVKAYLTAGEANVRSPKRADQCFFDAGAILLRLNDKTRAQECWSRMSAAAREQRHKDEMLWHVGFYYYRQKAWDMAAERFLSLMRECPRSELAVGARYWLARSLEGAGRRVRAEEHYRVLAAGKVDFYYRTLSRQRLSRFNAFDHWADQPRFYELLASEQEGLDCSFLPLADQQASAKGRDFWAASDPGLKLGDLWGERAKVMQIEPPGSATPAVRQALARLKDLAAAGAMDLAQVETENIRDLLKKNGQAGSGASREQRLAAASALKDLSLRLFALSSAYLAETGQYREFVRLQYNHFSLLVSGRSEENQLKARRRFFPLAFPGEVQQASREFNLHPALLLAVIRTESYYHPHIISVANARGLMQLLPTTGQKAAERLNMAAPHPESLFDPEVNIRLGASYLAALLKEFDGQLPLAIASYNAGPFNVKRWLEHTEGEISLEEFIEQIPFDQTRVYVKKVLGAFFNYRYLFSGEVQSPDLAAPVRPVFRNEIDF